MNVQQDSAGQTPSNGTRTFRRILALFAGLGVLVVLACVLGGLFVSRRVSQVVEGVRNTVQQAQREIRVEQAVQRARFDEIRRQNIIETLKARATQYQRHYQFIRDARIGQSTAFDRAVHEDPESFAGEFQVKQEFLDRMAATTSLVECERLAAELEAKVVTIRIQRYRRELESLRADVARDFKDIEADAFCVIELVPPFSGLGQAAFGAALAFDLIAGTWMVSAATLGEVPVLPISQSILKSAGQPRIAIVRGRGPTIEYLVDSVFAENHFEGVSREACPWRLIAACVDAATAVAAAEKAASEWREEQQRIRDSGRSADPRPIRIVLELE